MTSAIIIDDHKLFSGGFKHLVSSLDGVKSTICVENPRLAIESQFCGDVGLIVSDLYIPGYNMFDWISRLKGHFEKASLAVISSSISRTDRNECLLAGADTYFEKHADPQLVFDGLTALLENEEVINKFLERTAREAQNKGLTNKQIDVLVHLSRGQSVKEIANRFKVSPETVKTHLSNIYSIIGVSGRSAASDWAKQHSLT